MYLFTTYLDFMCPISHNLPTLEAYIISLNSRRPVCYILVLFAVLGACSQRVRENNKQNNQYNPKLP